MMESKKSNLAIVTGGTSGVGKEIALFLARKGYRLALVYKSNMQKAQDTVEQIQSENPNCDVRTFVGDVSSIEDSQRCYQEIKKSFADRPEILINSAGVTTNNLVIMEKPEVYERLIHINYLGAVYFCKLVAPDMIRQNYGRIINMSSVSAISYFEGHAAYAASKAALDKFSFIFGAELAKYKVTVNVIRPGLMLTPMTQDWIQMVSGSDRVSPERIMGPLRELIKPEEICNVVDLLLRSNQITCTGIDVDGGMSKYGKT